MAHYVGYKSRGFADGTKAALEAEIEAVNAYNKLYAENDIVELMFWEKSEADFLDGLRPMPYPIGTQQIKWRAKVDTAIVKPLPVFDKAEFIRQKLNQ